MRNWIKRIAIRKRGMEALQTVLLLGVAFVVVLGLRGLYNDNSPTVGKKMTDIISGGEAEEGGNKPAEKKD